MAYDGILQKDLWDLVYFTYISFKFPKNINQSCLEKEQFHGSYGFGNDSHCPKK